MNSSASAMGSSCCRCTPRPWAASVARKFVTGTPSTSGIITSTPVKPRSRSTSKPKTFLAETQSTQRNKTTIMFSLRTLRLCEKFFFLLLSGSAFAAGPTFYRDVLPILQKRCQECHRPGEVAPMAFLTYRQTRPWAKAIREAVLLKKMPPWFAEPGYGPFSNDRSLSQPEIDTLVGWADSGVLEGNVKDGPPPRPWVSGWNIAKPDVVLE